MYETISVVAAPPLEETLNNTDYKTFTRYPDIQPAFDFDRKNRSVGDNHLMGSWQS